MCYRFLSIYFDDKLAIARVKRQSRFSEVNARVRNLSNIEFQASN